jgi:hypothetical protein
VRFSTPPPPLSFLAGTTKFLIDCKMSQNWGIETLRVGRAKFDAVRLLKNEWGGLSVIT